MGSLSSQVWAVIGAFVSIAMYVIVSLASGKNVSGSRAFFGSIGGPIRATISLTCYNITLGTGIAYLITQANMTGWLVLGTPISMAIGYVLLSKYLSSLNFQPSKKIPNIYRLILNNNDGVSYLTRYYSILICITFIMLLAFEIWIGSELISKTIFVNPNDSIRFWVAFAIYFIVALYTSIAGLRGAVDTDIVQIVLIIMFIVASAIIIASMSSISLPVKPIYHSISISSVMASVLAVITALTTQFYSIVNLTFVPHLQIADQRKVTVRAGVIAATYYLVIIWMFTLWGNGADFSNIASEISSGTIRVHGIVVAVFAAGLVAVTMSTLDNATVAISSIVYDNWLGGNSADDTGIRNIKILRFGHFLVSIFAFIIAVILIRISPNLFYTLLTALFAVSVLSPILCVAIWLHRHGYKSIVNNRGFVIALASLTIAGWIIYARLSLNGHVVAGSAFHLAALGIAGSLAYLDYFKGVRGEQRRESFDGDHEFS